MNGAAEGVGRRIADRFEQVAITSARFVAYVRTVALVILGLWLAWAIPAPRVYYYELVLAVFSVLGWVNFHVSRRMGTEHWLIFVFAFIDMGLLTFAILSENPFAETPLPVVLHYRLDAFVFFFLMFSGVLHSYSPRLVLWSGISIALRNQYHPGQRDPGELQAETHGERRRDRRVGSPANCRMFVGPVCSHIDHPVVCANPARRGDGERRAPASRSCVSRTRTPT